MSFLDENIIAYTDLAEALKDVDAILFVVPTKVTRLVAQQVAKPSTMGLSSCTHQRD